MVSMFSAALACLFAAVASGEDTCGADSGVACEMTLLQTAIVQEKIEAATTQHPYGACNETDSSDFDSCWTTHTGARGDGYDDAPKSGTAESALDCLDWCANKKYTIVTYFSTQCYCYSYLGIGGWNYAKTGATTYVANGADGTSRRRSCTSWNGCDSTDTSDPPGGPACVEFATAGTCLETCDVTSDSRRRDGRRRKGVACDRRRRA